LTYREDKNVYEIFIVNPSGKAAIINAEKELELEILRIRAM